MKYMVDDKFKSLWRNIKRSHLLEPTIFLYIFSIWIVNGSELQTNLLIRKMCQVELGYNETVCDNLDAPEYEDQETEVQRNVNHFQMISSWMGSVPSLFYSLFVGALSDSEFGRKPLMIFPIFGQIVASICDIINFTCIDILPIEFFYTEQIFALFGGQSVYYLGYYSYGSSISQFADRSTVLTRYDGVEQFGMLVGTLLSPVVFNWIDYLGTFCVKTTCLVLAFVYIVFVLKEPEREGKIQSTKRGEADGKTIPVFTPMLNWGLHYLIKPLISVFATVFKKRERNLRGLILLQLFIYGCYWFMVQQAGLMYLYLMNVFPGFNGTDYSHYLAFIRVVGIIACLGLIPVLSKRFRMHEALILVIVNSTVSLGHLLMAFATKLWQIYVCEAISMLRISQYGTARTLFTKCIDTDEVGKLYSAIAFIAAIAPIVSNPAYRLLYDKTMDSFPAAFLILTAAIGALLVGLNFLIYTQRHKMLIDGKGNKINHPEAPRLPLGYDFGDSGEKVETKL